MTPELTEWLRVMLEEIARKRQDAERDSAEALARRAESPAAGTPQRSHDPAS